MKNCIFCQIINKKIPINMHYEDKNILIFDDVAPQAPVHFLTIPKQHIDTIAEVDEQDIIAQMFMGAQQTAAALGIAKGGYRLVFNCNEDGGQTVYHIHLHCLGGRALKWPPG